MENDTTLRTRVKEIKCYQNVNYKELAEYMEMKPQTFYSWLQGLFNFSDANRQKLEDILDILKE